MRCDRCETPIASGQYDAKTSLAQCDACGLVFELLHAPTQEQHRPLARRRRQVSLPERIEIETNVPEDQSNALLTGEVMSYRDAALDRPPAPRPDARVRMRFPAGSRLGAEPMGCGVVVGVMALIAIGTAISVGAGIEAIIGLVAFGVPACVYAVWVVLANTINKTTILLENGSITVTQGPIPVGRPKMFPATDITQIWTRRTMHNVPKGKGGPELIPQYRVELRVKNDAKPLTLVHELDDRVTGLYIEQVLEHALGIIDVAVPREDD